MARYRVESIPIANIYMHNKWIKSITVPGLFTPNYEEVINWVELELTRFTRFSAGLENMYLNKIYF